MNNHDIERDARLQTLAEQAERRQLSASGDPTIDRYRLVMRALQQPLPMQLPADFAAKLAARVLFPEENTGFEDWLVTVLLVGMAVAGVIYVQPVMASVIGHLHLSLPTLPWPLLLAAAASVGVAWLLDRGASSWRRGHRGQDGHHA